MPEGGGSFEDLFGFNDEALARAVFTSKIPIVSAVGHETDFTICDFVSDLRAPTPSAAAELVYPSEADILTRLNTLKIRMNTTIVNMLDRRKQYLLSMKQGRLEKTPTDLIAKYMMMLDNIDKRVISSIQKELTKYRSNYEKQVALLDSFSPLKTMARGYSVATKANGKLITMVSEVDKGDKLIVKVTDGKIETVVENIM